MSIPKPTIILVPGAWHGPEAFAPVTSLLSGAGYTVTGITLPSVGASPALPNFDKDVAAIREAIVAAADQEQDVFVVMHSYGGVCGSEATKGLSKSDRRSDGKRGGVAGLVYLCAFALERGKSLNSMLPADGLKWIVEEGEGMVRADGPANIFYNGVEKEVADKQIKALKLHSAGAFDSKVTFVAWKEIPSTYLVCEKDNAIPVEAQDKMATQKGGKWKVERCDEGHSPFLSKPDMVARVIRKAAGETV